jgi:5-methylcytosine-specific restriction protein B
MEIEPYLEEYFFDDAKSVAQFRWERIKSSLGL